MVSAAGFARRIAGTLLNHVSLTRRCANLEAHARDLEAHLHRLQNAFNETSNAFGQVSRDYWQLREHVYWKSALIYKAFQISGLWGDYLEFGVFQGGSMRQAYGAARRLYVSLTDGSWDFALADKEVQKAAFAESFAGMRFIGFDSFAGMPATGDVAAEVFAQGTYVAGRAETERGILEDIPREQLILVEGFFDETCTPETATRLAVPSAAVIHIDSDLYSSAVTALDFCTPYLRNGTVIIFDEYLQFHGNPHLGEQRAFAEWRRRHPEWLAQEVAREGCGRVAFVLNPAADPVAEGAARLD